MDDEQIFYNSVELPLLGHSLAQEVSLDNILLAAKEEIADKVVVGDYLS